MKNLPKTRFYISGGFTSKQGFICQIIRYLINVIYHLTSRYHLTGHSQPNFTFYVAGDSDINHIDYLPCNVSDGLILTLFGSLDDQIINKSIIVTCKSLRAVTGPLCCCSQGLAFPVGVSTTLVLSAHNTYPCNCFLFVRVLRA